MSSSARTASACNSRPPSSTSTATNSTPARRRIAVETVPPAASTKWDLAPAAQIALVGDEALYDVANAHGKFLLLGVTHTAACQAIDEHQDDPDMHPQWHGDIRIHSVRRGPTVMAAEGSAA